MNKGCIKIWSNFPFPTAKTVRLFLIIWKQPCMGDYRDINIIKFNWRMKNIWMKKMIKVTIYGGDTHDDVMKWKHFPRYWPFMR